VPQPALTGEFNADNLILRSYNDPFDDNKIDIVIGWKYMFSNEWKVNSALTKSEKDAWLTYTRPFLAKCEFCDIWFNSCLGADFLPANFLPDGAIWDHIMTIWENIIYKSVKNRKGRIFMIDIDDTVSYSYWDQLRNYLATEVDYSVKTCYAADAQFMVFPFEEEIRCVRDTRFDLRIMQGYTWDRYINPSRTPHTKWKQQKDCKHVIFPGTTAWYIQRRDSSSNGRNPEQYDKNYRNAKPCYFDETSGDFIIGKKPSASPSPATTSPVPSPAIASPVRSTTSGKECPWPVSNSKYYSLVHLPSTAPFPGGPVQTVKLPHDVVVKMHNTDGMGWFFKALTSKPIWEASTFEYFYSLINPEVTYLGFGEWNGITALYASNFAARTIGIEADPLAFSILEANAKLSKHKIEVSNLAISTENGCTKMLSRGDSKGHIEAVKGDADDKGKKVVWVKSVTLQSFMQNANVTGKLFIKIDCEGCEHLHFSTWREQFFALSPVPVVHISIHPADLTQEQIQAQYAFLNYFPHIWTTTKSADVITKINAGSLTPENQSQFSRTYLCMDNEMFNFYKTKYPQSLPAMS